MVVVAGGRALVCTGPGVDVISVSTEPATGWVVIDVNGVKHYQPRETAVTIRGGQGNDTITASAGILDALCIEVADVTGLIKLDGSPEFRERILGGLSLGQGRYLTDRPGSGGVLTIRELTDRGTPNGQWSLSVRGISRSVVIA